MDLYLHKHWWLYLLKSLGLLALGIFAIVWPDLRTQELAVGVALYLLLSGIVDIIIGVRDGDDRRMWFLPMLLGVGAIAAGIYLLRQPDGIVVREVVLVAASVLIAQGVVAAIEAYSEPTRDSLQRLLVSGGALAVLAGFFLFRFADANRIDDFLWLLGGFGLIGGALGIATALRHNDEHNHDEQTIVIAD